MDFLWDKITEWLKEMLIGGIVSNLSGMFDATNQKVAEISGQVGLSPQAWNGSIFSMIQNLSETVIVPIAGAILAFVMTLELIQLITDKNNLNDMDTWIFFKWAFKSAAAVLMNEARFSNIFIEKRASTCPQSLEKSRLFSYALLVSECENFQNMKRIFLRKVVI